MLSSAFTRAWNRHWLHYNPVLNMNEKVTTSYTIAHTVSGTVLVRLAKTTFRGANSETSIALRCYSDAFLILQMLQKDITIAGYHWTVKTHLENDILSSPTIDFTQLQLRKDLKILG